MPKNKYILNFSHISSKDLAIVGGKNASLGEMYNILTKKGINIPNGFSTTVQAFTDFLTYNNFCNVIINFGEK